MERRWWTVTLVVGLVFPMAISCDRPAKRDANEEMVLAQIGEVKITVKEFQDTINSYTPYLRSKYTSFEKKKEKLEEMVRFELLALEAKSRGYDKDPMVKRALRQSLVRELIQREVEDKVKLEDISEEEMRKYYEDHPEKYHKPAQRRAAHILITDKALAERVLKEALASEQDAVKFRDLVMKYSEDPVNKQHGGDLGYFSPPGQRTEEEPKIDDKLLEALYQLQNVGEIHKQLIQTPKGFHILKFTSTKPEVNRTYEQVKRQIQSILWRQKRDKAKEDFIKSLREKTKIEINEEVLKEIKIPEPQQTEWKGHGEVLGGGGEVGVGGRPPQPIVPGPTLLPGPITTPIKVKPHSVPAEPGP